MKKYLHIFLGIFFLVPVFLLRLAGLKHRGVKWAMALVLACAALFFVEWPWGNAEPGGDAQSAAKPRTARERMLAMSRNRVAVPGQAGQHGEVSGHNDPDVPPPYRGLSEEELAQALGKGRPAAVLEAGGDVPPPLRGLSAEELARVLGKQENVSLSHPDVGIFVSNNRPTSPSRP